jgi:hypothetical protein
VFEEEIDFGFAVSESAGDGQIQEEFAVKAVGLFGLDQAERGGIEEAEEGRR